MAGPSDDPHLERLAYELSATALARQEGALDELRRRTGTLLAASSLVASFLGGRAATGQSGFFTFAALCAFVASAGATVYVLMPKGELIFGLRGSVLINAESGDPGGIDETYRRLAHWIEAYLDANQKVIDRLSRVYEIATLAVLGQVLFWVSELTF